MQTSSDETSESVQRKLKKVNGVFPGPWRGKFIDCSFLEDRLQKADEHVQQEFFAAVAKQVDWVNAVFRATSALIIREHTSSFASKWKKKLSKALKNLAELRKHGSLEASACVEYARLNSAALRLVLQKHDRTYCSNLGQIYYDSLWKNQIGNADFLHSASLSELRILVELGGGECVQCTAEMSPSPWEAIDRSFHCPVCLDVLFRPVALGCGHIFCLPCAKTVAGLEDNILGFDLLAPKVDPTVLCPECRQPGVFLSAREVTTLDQKVRKFFPEIWGLREKIERENDCKRKEKLLGILEELHGV